jgi:hypothetical protein
VAEVSIAAYQLGEAGDAAADQLGGEDEEHELSPLSDPVQVRARRLGDSQAEPSN